MATTVKLANDSEHDVEVLVTDSQGHQVKTALQPKATSDVAVAPGQVFVKLFRPGSRGGRGFGMALMSADLTTATIDSGDLVTVCNGTSGPVIKKD